MYCNGLCGWWRFGKGYRRSEGQVFFRKLNIGLVYINMLGDEACT